jgi:drug/metabolite transporter (DMT)-like permease
VITLASLRLFLLSLAALLAFAANSVICRLALADGAISPAAFTLIRLLSGALMLAFLMLLRAKGRSDKLAQAWADRGFWPALYLLIYAAAFSFAYIRLETATGALILFAMVQASMIGVALWRGMHPSGREWLGIGIALSGLGAFLLPGASAPDPVGALLMGLSGVAWGFYSLHGAKKSSPKSGLAHDPIAATAGNFLMASLMALPLFVIFGDFGRPHASGLFLAILSGAVTSGLGYVIWYKALPKLSPSLAALSQTSVPLLAALGGIVFVGEALSTRFIISSILVLGGLLLLILKPKAQSTAP